MVAISEENRHILILENEDECSHSHGDQGQGQVVPQIDFLQFLSHKKQRIIVRNSLSCLYSHASILKCFPLLSPHEPNHCLSSRFLTYCPSKRILSDEGLKHEYFKETPLPIEPSMFPTWPAKSEQQRVKRGTSPRPPEGGLGYSQLVRTLGSTFSITYSYQTVCSLC